jgi:hypothetical protein
MRPYYWRLTTLMAAAAYLARRNAYRYPAVGLDGSIDQPLKREFESLKTMEAHHRILLRSNDDAKTVLGYLSVVYWGHYSSQRQVARGARALGKVRMARARLRGATFGVPVVATKIRKAVGLVDSGQYGGPLSSNLSTRMMGSAARSSRIAPASCA